MEIPFNCRRLSDGSYYLPRADKVKEAFLDDHFIRIGNERRWVKQLVTADQMIALDSLLRGQELAIVGKGPSLDGLEHIEGDVIIAINQAVYKVDEIALPGQTVIMMQQDVEPKDTCLPKDGIVLVREQVGQWYQDCDSLITYNPAEFGCTNASLTALVAIKMSQVFEVSKLRLYCFDALNGVDGYADCTGVTPDTYGRDPSRFLKHAEVIRGALELVDYSLIFPSQTYEL